MGDIIFDPSRVDTSSKHQLGFRAQHGDGKEYVYLRTGADCDAADAVLINHDQTCSPIENSLVAAGTGRGKLVAVANMEVPSGSYAWFQIYGACMVNAGANCAAHTELNTTGTGGRLDDGNTSPVVGITLTVARGSGNGPAAAFAKNPRVFEA